MKTGFTLLELTIAVAIATVVLITLSSIFIAQYNLYSLSGLGADINFSVTNILRAMEKLGANASTVVSTRVFGQTNFVSNESTLILALPAIDQNNNPLTSSDFMVIFRDTNDNKKLYLQIDADATSSRHDLTKLLSNLTDALQFSYNKSNPADATVIEIFVSLKKAFKNTAKEKGGRTTIFLRNK